MKTFLVLPFAVLVILAGHGCKPSTAPFTTVQLAQRDPASGAALDRGMSGSLQFRPSGPTFDFIFEGRRLKRAETYTLLYLPEPLPGTGLIRLAQGTADGGGNLRLTGSVQTGSLPSETDANRAAGARICLVPSRMVGAEGIQDWDPGQCLLETQRIRYTATPPVSAPAPAP